MVTSAFEDSFFSYSKKDLEKEMDKHNFFHDMDLGEFRTGSWVYPEDLPPNYHLYPTFELLSQLDLDGSRVIDIGSYDGMTAFILAELGALHVDATCQFDLDRFRLVRAYREYRNVAYHPKTDLSRISQSFDMSVYDLVCMTAMLHHLLSPLEALMIARKLLSYQGYLIIEASILPGKEATMVLNTELEDPVVGAPTIWLPTESAMEGMLKLAGFDLISRYDLKGGALAREPNYQRVTYLARACRPSEIKNRSAKLEEAHKVAGWNHIIDFPELENNNSTAKIEFSGPTGTQWFNIWLDTPSAPMQPKWNDPRQDRNTQFKIGTNNDFMELMHDQQDDLWTKEDTTLLAANYPGEIFPEGMTWCLKQYANLFCLSYIKHWGLKDILEIGAGFNLYFDRHLPEGCNYTVVDDEGFYEGSIIEVAKEQRKRGHTISTLLGQFSDKLVNESFDCCLSSSVLEHVPTSDIQAVIRDMHRTLKPGGWAVHSIDLTAPALKAKAEQWLQALRQEGFLVSDEMIDLDLDRVGRDGDEPFIEPLSIINRFYGGFQDKPWATKNWHKGSKRIHTVLFAARKPLVNIV